MRRVRASLYVVVALVFFLSACGGGGGSNPPNGSPGVTVSIAPASVKLLVRTSAKFEATVSGASNPSVTYTVVQGPAGGQILNSGDYLASGAPGIYTVRATSVADPNKFAQATVTVRDYAANVTPGSEPGDGYDLHTASLLPDSSVLIVGGRGYNEPIHQQAIRYLPGSGTYAPDASLTTPRMAHVAITRPDGAVIIAGGINPFAPGTDFDPVYRSTEIYDPDWKMFHAGPDMTAPRRHHVATLLKDGRTFITGGIQLRGSGFGASPNTEIYDPLTNTFSESSRMAEGRWLHTATLLKDGRVLIVGGRNNNCTERCPIYSLNSTEIFDPATGSIAPTGSLNISRYNHSATLLDDGRVLILGGETTENLGTDNDQVGPTEIYDPTTGQFSKWTNLVLPRSSHAVTLLNNGKLWLTGGYRISGMVTQRTELFDPSTGISVEGPALREQHIRHSAIRLTGGEVLIFGGSNGNQPMPIMEILK
jgi:hypothetical protein